MRLNIKSQSNKFNWRWFLLGGILLAFVFMPTMETIAETTIKYCFSEDKINCARYKLIKAGKETPDNLLADGSRIEVKSQ